LHAEVHLPGPVKLITAPLRARRGPTPPEASVGITRSIRVGLAAPSYTPAMTATLFTIGYQGVNLEQVVASLSGAGVSVLVDTRETPMSRRVEFRQKALASALDNAGIRYISVRALGAPKPLRAMAADDWDAFSAGYRERLLLVREELERLIPARRVREGLPPLFRSRPRGVSPIASRP
jgi:hypothetical protein